MRFSDKVFTLSITQTATNRECKWCGEHGSWLEWLYIKVPSLALGRPFSFFYFTHMGKESAPLDSWFRLHYWQLSVPQMH